MCAVCASGLYAVDFLPVPNSQKGTIAIVNRQSRLPEADLLEVCAQIAKATKCNAEVASGERANVTIEVVDDATTPILTAYPEDYKTSENLTRI